jgi:predicted nucleic acid-binding protein
LEAGADALLMDERLGRETARHLGVRCIGLIGVLVEAKQKGIIAAVKYHLDALRDIAGFRISGDLYARVLHDQGEVKS